MLSIFTVRNHVLKVCSEIGNGEGDVAKVSISLFISRPFFGQAIEFLTIFMGTKYIR